MLNIKVTNNYESDRFTASVCGNKYACADLEVGKNMDIEFRDIIYFQKDDTYNGCRLKYNTMTNNKNMTWAEYEAYRKAHNGFSKGLIWFYEKETRLLVKLKEELRNGLNKPGKSYIVVMTFDEKLCKEFQVTFAPNVQKGRMQEVLQQHPAICSLHDGSSKVKPSDFAGTVEFNLCKNCSKADRNK